MNQTSEGQIRSLSGVGTLKPVPITTTQAGETTTQTTTTAEKPKETKQFYEQQKDST